MGHHDREKQVCFQYLQVLSDSDSGLRWQSVPHIFSYKMCQIYFLFLIFSPALGSDSRLNNAHIKLGAEAWPPYLVIERDKNGTDKYSGMSWDLLQMIQKGTNCTFTIVRPQDGLWGNCYGINNCSGMIGMVQRKEVDFAIGIFSCISNYASI